MIVILGAGPAGAATALKLAYLGIPCTIVDRAAFPRDKVCGDALSGKVPVLLDRLDPAILQRLRHRYAPTDVWGIRFSSPSARTIDLPFSFNYQPATGQAPGYVAKRMDFDNFLVDELRRHPGIDLRLRTEVTGYDRHPNGYRIELTGGTTLDAQLLIDATGAHSRFARHAAGLEVDHAHHAAAVRTYYKGVTGFHDDNFIELHFLEQITPGYFWVFKLPNGEANIGLGVRTDILKKKKLNLRRVLDEIVASPRFRERFAGAERTGPVEGYGLPLGSKDRTLSGDHYLLVGDAGHLIDPLTGEGIGNGMYSGIIAAEQAAACLETQRFDAAFLADYDRRIDRVLRSEMRVSYRLQQMLRYVRLTNFIAAVISANQSVLRTLSRMYTDLDLRKQLINPVFWVRALWSSDKGMLNEK